VARRLGLTVSPLVILKRTMTKPLRLSPFGTLGPWTDSEGAASGTPARVRGRRTQAIDYRGEITDRLQEKMLESGQSVEQFGDAIGWDIKELLSDPKALWSFNVEVRGSALRPLD
jgi:hypothetical protein